MLFSNILFIFRMSLVNSSGIRMIFRSFRYRNYKLFFAGQSISLIGTWMQRIAMPWLVYHITGSVLMLGVVSFTGQIPTFILAPFAGVLTDRMNKYHLLIASQVLAMLQAATLTALFYSDMLQMWHIISLSIVWGIFTAFDVPSRHSFVVEMVQDKEDLGNAIALNSLMFNSARLIGPSVAGILLAAAGEGICFLINAISYIFVIGSLLMMNVNKASPHRPDTDIFVELRNGLKYAWDFLPIRHVIVLLSIIGIMSMPYIVLMPVFAKEVLNGDSQTFGFLVGAGGFGALIGGIYLASKRTLLRIGRIIPYSAAVFGAGIIALSFSRSLYISLTLMVIAGMGIMLHTASCNTILQTITDDDKRGRIMSLYTMAIMGTAPFGSLLAGWLAKMIGTPYTILTGGIVCIAGALYFNRKLPELKDIARTVYMRMGVIPQVASGLQTASEPSMRKME